MREDTKKKQYWSYPTPHNSTDAVLLISSAVAEQAFSPLLSFAPQQP